MNMDALYFDGHDYVGSGILCLGTQSSRSQW